MPGFSAAYSDREIADAANFVTARFGSHPSRVMPGTSPACEARTSMGAVIITAHHLNFSRLTRILARLEEMSPPV